ncbi:hypothetical protein [Micromonospora sp. NPDC047527]|uniref:hypothetical protein n=1 Tax=Micromonospora sp. NPDC047527 TaxID=3155144 RepID=UPI0033F57106
MSPWFVILVAGIGSYAMRICMTLTDRLIVPPRLEASAEMVAPAAFAALASASLTPLVFSATGLSAAAPVVLAVAAAVAGTAGTGKPYVAMLAGMPTYWVAAALM